MVPDWERAYEAMLDLVRPGGRVGIMDAGYPSRRGEWDEVRIARPLWQLACKVAAVHEPSREPWRRIREDLVDTSLERFGGGYVWVASGTKESLSLRAEGP